MAMQYYVTHNSAAGLPYYVTDDLLRIRSLPFVWRQRLGRTAKPETESSGIFMTAYPSKHNYYQIAREVSGLCLFVRFCCLSVRVSYL